MSSDWWPNISCGSSHEQESSSSDWMFMEVFLSVPPRVNTNSSIEAILILDCDWLWGRTNLQKFLYAFPYNHKLFVSHSAIYMIPFHTSIWEKFLYDLQVYNSNWIQELCLRPFPEHYRYASVLKGIQLDNHFHDNRGSFVAVIVFQICLNRLKIIKIRACMLWGWSFRSWMFGRRHLHIKTENKETCAQTQNRTQNLIRFKLVPNQKIKTT